MIVNLANVDLNLLKAFDALIRERQVTRAAKRIGLTQPAMSNALARLRHLFKDELFVRTPDGMVPTARARQLAAPLQQALCEIKAALESSLTFDPASAERALTIATTDISILDLLSCVAARSRTLAPGITLRIRYVERGSGHAVLEDGAVDLVAGTLPDPHPRSAFETLFAETAICLASPRWVRRPRELSLREFLELPHIVVSPTERSTHPFDQQFARRGLERRVALVVPSPALVPFVLSTSDFVAVLPSRTARPLLSFSGLQRLPIPFELAPYDVGMMWHVRDSNDPANAWLRGVIRDALRDEEVPRGAAAGLGRVDGPARAARRWG
jgi:DNA-binding transcriptional LysR family regulator